MNSAKHVARAMALGVLVLGSLSAAQARPWKRPRRHHHRRRPVVVRPAMRKRPVVVTSYAPTAVIHLPLGAMTIRVNSKRYHYHHGTFFRRRGSAFVQVKAPCGAIVTSLPTAHKLKIVDGRLYYIYGGTYFRRVVGGYAVVAAPLVAHRPPRPARRYEETIWLLNENGSKTPVTLERREGGAWVGPKGEYYDELPTAGQLASVYGLGVYNGE